MSLTRAQLGHRLERLAAKCATFRARVLIVFPDRLNDPAKRKPVERFIRDMRQRLNDLEQELNS
jgi:hypothetical protein